MTTVKSISQGILRPYPPGGIATSIDIAHLITVLITYRDLSGRRRRLYVGSGSLPELGLSACSLALALFCCTLQFVSLTKKLSSSKRSTIWQKGTELGRNFVVDLSLIHFPLALKARPATTTTSVAGGTRRDRNRNRIVLSSVI